jgi:hypothetical protein
MPPITSTTSLPAAAFAMAHGSPLPRLVPSNIEGTRFDFVWDNDPDGEIGFLFKDYFKGESASGRDFFRALQDIRVAVNSAKNGGTR